LDISDLSDGNYKLCNSEFYFNGMMCDILNRAEQMLETKNQTLTTGIDPSIPETLIGDERRLAQVINSLLSIACKFAPDYGSIHINAFETEHEDGFHTIQIDVKDSGAGIPEDKQAAVYAAFAQVDGVAGRKYGGTGMGLDLSKIIVGKMGGDIWLESEPGRGSRFSCTFKMQAGRQSIEDETEMFFGDYTMLLVDDIDINREIIMAILEETQMQFVCAANGREAVDIFKASPSQYDIIFMDINMPEMDGVEATRHIRSLDIPEAAAVPIIAVSANMSMGEVENYLSAGMTDYLGKPADFEKIMRMITLYLAENEEMDLDKAA